MSDTIMSIQEIIDNAFSDETANCTINFRLLKTLIVILANQLRVLNRQVQVSVNSGVKYPHTHLHPSLVVSEIKIQVEDEKKEETKERKKEKTRKNESESKRDGRRRQQGQGSKEMAVRKKQNDRQKELTEKVRISRSVIRGSTGSSVKSGGAEEELALQEGAAIRKTTADDLEVLREREIRIISQRADSHEDPALSPSPMASVHSMGKENLLIVSPQGRTPRINVVTKEQFDELADAVRELEARFDPIGIPGFPENAEFLKALRTGASLTDAMAALQMSARLLAFEKSFIVMMSLLTELAKKTPGVNVTQFRDLETNFGRGVLNDNKIAPKQECVTEYGVNDFVSRDEFNNAMQELYDEVKEMVKKETKPTVTDAKKTEILISQLEWKIKSHNFDERIEAVEEEIIEYGEKFINLDNSLSSQIASFQEQLTQLQYQLEAGMENMLEKVAHTRSNPEALVELNVRLDALQQDIENAALEQKNLRAFQNNMTFDLVRLWKEIELIRDAKADRDEVDDKLRDKAGIENLNGMVSASQFESAFSELETNINSSHAKFHNQELVWQTALDDLTKLINEKGDWIHICALRDDINRHLNNLRDKLDGLIEVVGEPRAAAIRKKLFGDSDCVCCGTPAGMNIEVHSQRLPDFKRASADGAEAHAMPKEDGDHGLCIPDHPRLLDSKTHMCQRFCGGSHTLMPKLTRAPPGITITHLPRKVTITIGSDGKAYETDELVEMIPCGRCNIPKAAEEPSKPDAAPKPPDVGRNTLSIDMSEMAWLAAPKHSSGSDYPPLPIFDDDDD